MVDSLDGLGHDPVVRGHDYHGYVRDLGATRAHGREGLMSRRIEERDPLAVTLDLVRADMLGNATRLARRDVRVADAVEQGGLAMVYMAKDRYDRRPGSKVGLFLALVRDGEGTRPPVLFPRRPDPEAERLGDHCSRLELHLVVHA